MWRKVKPSVPGSVVVGKWTNPFGNPLEKQVAQQNPNSVPPFISAAFQYILDKGLDEEGIFRVSGSISSVQRLQRALASGEKQTFHKDDPYDVACLVKVFFRELPEPATTFDLYDCFLGTSGLPEHYRVPAMTKLIMLLPPPNIALLKSLCEFIRKVENNKEKNKMGIDNLAIVFAPNLFRPENASIEVILADAGRANSVTKLLFSKGQEIFRRVKAKQDAVLRKIGNSTLRRTDSSLRGDSPQEIKAEDTAEQTSQPESTEEPQNFQSEPPAEQQTWQDVPAESTPEKDAPADEVTPHPENSPQKETSLHGVLEEIDAIAMNLDALKLDSAPQVLPFSVDTTSDDLHSNYDLPPIDAPLIDAPLIDAPSVDELPSLMLDAKLVKVLAEEAKSASENDVADVTSEFDVENIREFKHQMQKKAATLRNESVRRIRREKTRSLAIGQMDSYEVAITEKFCSIVLGVDQAPTENSYDAAVYSDLYRRTLRGLKNFNDVDPSVDTKA
eukprot:TRINITY_DN3323_c0_g1_i1.p1 TRINITY_DN3323_c0_g1~~TRINITY_DN3323_c0_g1_i1.p1  ORF type:complete len:503 (+),score=134.88 TRINITY_DN3323_c0_g1_i1:163-1671(+)